MSEEMHAECVSERDFCSLHERLKGLIDALPPLWIGSGYGEDLRRENRDRILDHLPLLVREFRVLLKRHAELVNPQSGLHRA
jgi:hypothetical protein